MNISVGMLKNLRLEVKFKQSVIAELTEVIERFTSEVDPENPQDMAVTAISANLARLYTGIEDILEDIVKVFDDYRPTGDSWHSALLAAALMESDDRPAIISRSTFDMLDELRGFRHIVHKAYAKPFDWTRMKHLATSVQSMLQAVSGDLTAFNTFLAKAIETAEAVGENR